MTGRIEEVPSLGEVVRHLTRPYVDPGDWPADHRCARSGVSGRPCSHARWASRSLLARLADLVEPGRTGGQGGGAHRGRTLAGSPAPWSAAPAELLDEIQWGAIALEAQAEAVLGEEPMVADPAPLQGARLRRVARASLVVLPEQHGVLLTRHPEHPLVRGRLLVPGDESAGYGWGLIEARLRGWYSRARTLTGHEQPPVVLRYHPNPVDDRGIGGPVCPGECLHHSCERARYSRLPRYLPIRCPACGARGLTQDQTTGGLACTRPSCRRPDGGRTVWSLDVLRSEWRATLWSVS